VGFVEKTAYGTYRARWRDPQGKTQSETFKKRAEADAQLVEKEGSKSKGAYVAPATGRILFGIFTADVMKARALSQRPSTQASDQSVMNARVLPHFANRRLSLVTPLEIQRWVNATAETHSASTTRKAAQVGSQRVRRGGKRRPAGPYTVSRYNAAED